MAKTKVIAEGQARFLDLWSPPIGAGSPIGCIATTYTFGADFFENECLSRFLEMKSDAVEDGSVYLMEREEKLGGIECAAVWVDQSNAGQPRNLRWDLIPYRLAQGIQHAKIVVLHWKHHVRVMIGSANLTKEGYQKNREVMAVLDVSKGAANDKTAVLEILKTLQRWMSTNPSVATASNQRQQKFLEKTKRFVTSLELSKERRKKLPTAIPIFIEPGKRDFFGQIQQIWKECIATTDPACAYLISPFFDAGDNRNIPLEKLAGLMRNRGQANIHLAAMGQWNEKNRLEKMFAPQNLRKTIEDLNKNINVHVEAIKPQQKIEKKWVNRDLHAKCYWFENDPGDIIYVIGSSNFTSRGLGLTKACNLEANLAFVFNKKKDKKLFRELEASWIDGDDQDVDICKVEWEAEVEEGMETEQVSFLPTFFQSAVVKKTGDKLCLELIFSGGDAPLNFQVRLPDDPHEILMDYPLWSNMGKPESVLLPLSHLSPPSLLQITWDGIVKPLFMPVQIASQDCLPHPEELANIPMSLLTTALSTSKPMYEIYRNYIRSKKKQERSEASILDPLKQVDTSRFLLKRTNSYAFVISGIKEKLEKPYHNVQAIEWRINSPVGIKAVIEAMIRQAASNSEAVFHLVEVLMVLAELNPSKDPDSIKPATVKRIVAKLISELKEKTRKMLPDVENKAIVSYAKRMLSNY